jgi:hypothetical protein
VRYFQCALAAAFVLAAPAASQPIQFSATVTGEAGYAVNPFVIPGVKSGTPFGSIDFAPKFVYQTARSNTSLTGYYKRDQYLNKFGESDNLSATLARTDQLTQYLGSSFTANYITTNNAIVSDPTLLINGDPSNIARRTNQVTVGEQLQWQVNERNSFDAGAQFLHTGYGHDKSPADLLLSSYTQYSVNGGYQHVLNARTSVGAQVSVSETESKLYPSSRAVQPSLTAKRQLTAVWNISGNVGLVLQHVGGPFASSSTNLGYGITLCGVYPRTSLCLSAQRSSAPSNYGALQTSTFINATLSHTLTEHSRVNFTANYSKRASGQSLFPGQNPLLAALQRSSALAASGEYDHDISRRLSAGFNARYQHRNNDVIVVTRDNGSADAFQGTIHITAKLGRM